MIIDMMMPGSPPPPSIGNGIGIGKICRVNFICHDLVVIRGIEPRPPNFHSDAHTDYAKSPIGARG